MDTISAYTRKADDYTAYRLPCADVCFDALRRLAGFGADWLSLILLRAREMWPDISSGVRGKLLR